MELSSCKSPTLHTIIILPLLAFTLIFLLAFSPHHRPFNTKTPQNIATRCTTAANLNAPQSIGAESSGDRLRATKKKSCDIFAGEWVPSPEAPYYYTNETWYSIQPHQNCMKYGRPDSGYLKWQWKPDGCELPVFDPRRFLELVRNKSLAFVGDSIARNHFQSLVCLLTRVAYPVEISNSTDESRKHMLYKDYNFSVRVFWSPYLVKTGTTYTELIDLYLDELDESWTSEISTFDYVIISAAHWFSRPTKFYLDAQPVGCLYCPEPNLTHLTEHFSYRWALRTALRAINSLENFKGVTFLRSLAPQHFENGAFDQGGECVRKEPFKRNDTILGKFIKIDMYDIQKQEFAVAVKEGRREFRWFDVTQAMLLRPDGHPNGYGHWPNPNVTMYNDCLHWCLPGPIDTWNDFLWELLKRERED
ncbi:PREDICTED: protein trichome birefringence-like 19 [Ipomoea nil]|uniref:protein trichome birefringence-like 19 n=1 Tax=Ipomoea nil TaxID=35883 RepID=UPI000901A65C|nr:PREDICTED: protein trichome birefringence-like 19 [Ipomoea nil]